MKKNNTYKEFQKNQKKRQAIRLLSFAEKAGKSGLFLLFFFVSYLGYSQVKVEIDTANIRIGEQFQYKISIDETENVIIPKLALKGLEIIDSTKIDTVKNSLIRKYILTGFDSGAFYIPQQQVFIKNQAYFTDSLLVNVATVAVDTTKVKKFAIKGIKSEPYQFDDFKNLFYWVLAALLIIGLLVYYFFFRKKKEEKELIIVPALAPFEEAMQKLQQLDEKLLWQNNHVKKYYSELTDIVRGYIERELKIPALESTTDQIVETLVDFNSIKSIETSKETIKTLKGLLQEADLVKFAKSKPMALEIEEDRKDAENIIANLKPKPIITEDELE